MIETNTRDRGVSISVTHVLTLGITTILIAMLLMSTSTLLETERTRNTEASLETIGEQIAHDISVVDQSIDNSSTITVVTDQPRQAGGERYTVTMLNKSKCQQAPLLSDSSDCLHLTASGTDAEAYVPIKTDTPIKNESSAPGGRIVLSYTTDTEEIRIEGED